MRRPDHLDRFPFGIVVIAVIMFFAAVGTLVFWVGNLVFGAFPRTMPVEPLVYNAFIVPDILLAMLLVAGAVGLIRLRKAGLYVTLVAMGMWLFDLLLVLGIMKLDRIGFVGACLFFVVFSLFYLWSRRDFFE